MSKKKPIPPYLTATNQQPIDLSYFDRLPDVASPEPVQKRKTGIMARMGDVALALGQGAVGSVKSISDVAGADNAVSRGLGSVSDFLGEQKSEQSRATLAASQQRIRDAEQSGDWKQEAAAYLGMIWDQPAEMLAQGVGSFATLGLGKAAQALKLTQAAKAAGMTKEAFLATRAGQEAAQAAAELGFKANIGVSAAQGLGGVKGSQFEQTYQNAIAAGHDPEQARAMATEAQAYGGAGTVQQLVGAGLGGLAAATGPIERTIAGRTARMSDAPQSFMGSIGKGFATEGATEGAQGAQERLAGNEAAISASVMAPEQRWTGVVGQGLQEGVIGGVIGGVAGPLDRQPAGPMTRAATAGAPVAPPQMGPIDFENVPIQKPQQDMGLGQPEGMPFEADPRFKQAPIYPNGRAPDRQQYGTQEAADVAIGEQGLLNSHKVVEARPGVFEIRPTAAPRVRMVQPGIYETAPQARMSPSSPLSPAPSEQAAPMPPAVPGDTMGTSGDMQTELDEPAPITPIQTLTPEQRRAGVDPLTGEVPPPPPFSPIPPAPDAAPDEPSLVKGPDGTARATFATEQEARDHISAGRKADRSIAISHQPVQLPDGRWTLALPGEPGHKGKKIKVRMDGAGIPGQDATLLDPNTAKPWRTKQAASKFNKTVDGYEVLQQPDNGWVLQKKVQGAAPVAQPGMSVSQEAPKDAAPPIQFSAEDRSLIEGMFADGKNGAQVAKALGRSEPQGEVFQAIAAARKELGIPGTKDVEAFKAWREGRKTVDAAAHEAAPSPQNELQEPSEAQQKSGNYRKGHPTISGLNLSIENPQGSVRRGKDRDGKEWENTLQHHYGYIKGTVGNDKDHVDAFVKPGTAEDYTGPVFVVDQIHPDTGEFDEHKALIGFATEDEARKAYAANYDKDWQGLKAITSMPFAEFKAWVKDGPKTQPVAKDQTAPEPAGAESSPTAQSQPKTEAKPEASKDEPSASTAEKWNAATRAERLDVLKAAGWGFGKEGPSASAKQTAAKPWDKLSDSQKERIGAAMAQKPEAIQDDTKPADNVATVAGSPVDAGPGPTPDTGAGEPGVEVGTDDTRGAVDSSPREPVASAADAAPAGGGGDGADAVATHKDPGEAPEPATAAVVRESLAKAAGNTNRKPADMKAELLAMVDEKIKDAKDVYLPERKQPTNEQLRSAMASAGLPNFAAAEKLLADQHMARIKEEVDKIGYATFNVPGDGTFKVLNTKSKLEEFRRKVETSPGFKASTPKPKPEGLAGGESGYGGALGAVKGMIDEGDAQAAVDYAAARGMNLSEVLKGDKVRLGKVAGLEPTGEPVVEAPADSSWMAMYEPEAPSTENQGAPSAEPAEEKPSPRALTTAEMVQKGRDDFAAGADRQTVAPTIPSWQVQDWMRGWDEAKADADAAGKVVKPSEFPLQEAESSYSGISHSGSSRAKSDRDAFVQTVQRLYDEALPLAEMPAQREALDKAIDKFKAEYLSQARRVIKTRAGTVSSYVAGRSNFNTKQADKRGTALDKALDSFAAWEKEAAPEVKAAVLAARTPEQIAKEQADKAAKQAEKDAKRRASDLAFMKKILNFKVGDTLKVGSMLVTKVSNDQTGYPLTLTLKAEDGSPLTDDKLNLATSIFGSRGVAGMREGKAKIRELVDAIRKDAKPPEQDPEAPAEKPKEAPKPASKTPTVDASMALLKAVRAGTATADEYKASFMQMVDNKDAVLAELSTKTKEELLTAGGSWFYTRNKAENKAYIVKRLYSEMLDDYALGKTYKQGGFVMMTAAGIAKREAEVAESLKALVMGQTDEDIKAFAKEIEQAKQENEAERAAKKAAMENPQTLSDFRSVLSARIAEGKTRKEAYLTLTPEQRTRYDELEAELTREAREKRKQAAKTEVRSAGQTTGGEVIATKHTRDGHDLWVVQLADRVSKEDYMTLLASAKKMGGGYSSFRGNGAIPGFQFRNPEAAQAFLKLAGGDTGAAEAVVDERRNAFEDDRSQTAVERLREMADKMEGAAEEELNRERKTNTARRARFAASAMAEADAAKAMARTMRNIAQAIEDGKAKFLDAVRTKTQVEMLTKTVRAAKDNELRAKYPSYGDQEKRKGEPPTAETADFSEFPMYTAFRSDLASLARQMLEEDGTKKMGQQLMKVADDVTEAYLEFAKANIQQVSRFSYKAGDEVKTAIFPNREMAEKAIKRSGLVGKAIVLAEKRGVNRVIMSPSEAISAQVWTGDGDKRITLTTDAGNALVEAIGRRGRASKITVPWQFQNTYDRRKALSRIGIETASEFRSALREFIALQERATANRVREMELKMVGKANDGLDFFPTPAEVADQMVEAADIKPDMAVLEPSAGMGHIADRIREAGAEPDVIEMAEDRRELLQEKGYNIQARDFLDMKPRAFYTYGDIFRAPDGTEGVMSGSGGMASSRVMLKPLLPDGTVDVRRGTWFNRDDLTGIGHRGVDSGYDRIIMNPPFSKRRDAEHVMHAYTLLKPGGRIVAIMGEGVFFGQDKKAEEFRNWLDEVGGTSEKLPEGSFMDPSLPVNTGVNARLVVIDRPQAAQKDETPVFSRSGPAKNVLDALKQNDDLFQLPATDAKTVEQITADIDPALKVTSLKPEPGQKERYRIETEDGRAAYLVVRAANPYGPSIYGFDLVDGEMVNKVEGLPGENIDAIPEGIEEVFIDASKLKEGSGGAKVYAIASALALNTDRLFIGDPAGLSDEALRRRSENMLSSALRYGTTEHLAPHPRQVAGDAKLGVPPLKWVYGDHVGNIERLIDVNLKALDNAGDGEDRTQFNPDNGLYQTGSSREVPGVSLTQAVADHPDGRAGTGGRTLARAAVWRALLRQGGSQSTGAGRGTSLLAELARLANDRPSAVERLFSRGAGAGMQPEALRATVATLTKSWSNAPEVVVVSSMSDPAIPAAVRSENDRQLSQGATGQPEGFFYSGKAYLVASQIGSEQDARRVLFHETLGHYGLRGTFGEGLKGILGQVVAARPREVRAKVMEYGLSWNSKADRLIAAEEVLAEMAQSTPELGFVRRAVAAIRTWLRNVGLRLGLSDAEIIRDFILPARQFVTGRRAGAGGGVVFSRGTTLAMSNESAPAMQSTEFKEWFGDSVVTKNGKVGGDPLTVYHGTNESFSEFSASLLGSRTKVESAKMGFFFTSNPKVAGYYTTGSIARTKLENEISSLVKLTGFRANKSDRTPERLKRLDEARHELARLKEMQEPVLLGEHETTRKMARLSDDLESMGVNIRRDMPSELLEVEIGKADDDSLAQVRSMVEQYKSLEIEEARAALEAGLGIGGNIAAVNLSIKNPFVYDFGGKPYRDESYASLIKKAIENGNDGVILKNTYDSGFMPDRALDIADIYVAFRPEQIKSAIGNRGTFDPENPDIRFSRSTDRAAQTIKAFDVKQAAKATGNTLAHYRGMAMQALGRRQIVELWGKDLPQLVSYSEHVQRMDAEKNDTAAEADAIADAWGKLKDERELAELMHDATVAQIDPAKGYQLSDSRADYDRLRNVWEALSPEAQAIYTKARDSYAAHYKAVKESITERIMRTMAAGDKRRALLERMEKDFFKSTKGVYFPLARFGKYVVVVRGKDGAAVAVSRAETINEAQEARARLVAEYPAAKGFSVGKILKDKEFNAAKDGPGKGFMDDLFEVLEGSNASNELIDSVGQLYLASLPDLSWAKHGIHRKGTPGFSQDARRAFAQNVFHGARYLARLRWADRLQDDLVAMQEHVQANAETPDFDSIKAQQVVDEMAKRHDLLMNPNSNPVSTALTSIGFVFHLGLSPASAMVNLLQTATTAYPVMGAKWGFDKAAAALMAASREAVKGKNDISTGLAGDELEAYKEAVKTGVIDVTMAHDLAGIATGEDAKVTWAMRPVMKAASFMFHHAEKFNRQVTFLAAYRLARGAGADHLKAYTQAVDATYAGHFDYSSANRPRFMQGNVAKVVLLFKQYAQNMIYLMARQAHQSLKGLTPEDRAEARKALAGILTTHAAVAGFLGLPLVGTILSVASWLGSDDDEPWDAEAALRNSLAETFGTQAADIMAKGLSRATPWDISGRVGLNTLIMPDMQEGLEGKDLWKATLEAAAGPVAAIGGGILEGLKLFGEGEYQRGAEAMLPAALRGPAKALRYGSEGAQDKTGVSIVDEVSAAGVAGQLLGLSPSEVRLATEAKSAVLSADKALMKRRSTLLNMAAKAAMAQDLEGLAEIKEQIQNWNAKNPGRAISGQHIRASVAARRRRIANAESGVSLPQNRRGVIEAGAFGRQEAE